MTNNDELRVEGILSKGYGISPKLVMKDKRLTIEAKAIYAYMSSYAGNGDTAFPSMELMERDLDVTTKRLRKHRELLVEAGYLEITRERNAEGRLGKNIYKLRQVINTPEGHFTTMAETTGGFHHGGKTPRRQNNPPINNSLLNNNSTSNNNSNNNNNDKELKSSYYAELIRRYEEMTGNLPTSYERESLSKDLEEFNFDLVNEAINQAIVNNARHYGYMQGVFRNWRKKGYKTLEQLQSAENARHTSVAEQQKNLVTEEDYKEAKRLADEGWLKTLGQSSRLHE